MNHTYLARCTRCEYESEWDFDCWFRTFTVHFELIASVRSGPGPLKPKFPGPEQRTMVCLPEDLDRRYRRYSPLTRYACPDLDLDDAANWPGLLFLVQSPHLCPIWRPADGPAPKSITIHEAHRLAEEFDRQAALVAA